MNGPSPRGQSPSGAHMAAGGGPLAQFAISRDGVQRGSASNIDPLVDGVRTIVDETRMMVQEAMMAISQGQAGGSLGSGMPHAEMEPTATDAIDLDDKKAVLEAQLTECIDDVAVTPPCHERVP